MTNREIRNAKQRLYEVLNKECKNEVERCDQVRALAEELNAFVPPGIHVKFPRDSINAITKNIHTVLQTEMMLNACASAEASSDLAKRSCKWAAIAAIAACISVILTGLATCLTVCSK